MYTDPLRKAQQRYLTVEDIMTPRELITVETREDLATAYDLMLENKIRHLPVVDKKRNLVGILSDRDLIREVLFVDRQLPELLKSANPRELLKNLTVEDVMTGKPETVGPDDDLIDVGDSLLDGEMSSLPVVRGAELIGIITLTDFLRAFLDSLTERTT